MAAPSRERGPGGPGDRGSSFGARLLRDLNILGLVLLIAASAGLLLSPGDDDSLLGLPELAQGDKAPRTIKSPRDFAIADPETTDRLRREAMSRVRPTYELVAGLGGFAKERLERAFSAASDSTGGEENEGEVSPATIEAFMRTLGVYLDEQGQALLQRARLSDELRDAAIMVVRTIYERQIVDDKELLKLQAPDGIQLSVLGPDGSVDHESIVFEYGKIIGVDEARVEIDEIVGRKLEHLGAEQRRAVSMLAKALLGPNLKRNDEETRRRASQARAAVKTVVIPIKRGESVLRTGERVTDRHLLILTGMARELEGQNRFQIPLGAAALIVLLVVFLYHFYRRSDRFLPSHRDLAFAATTFVGTLLLVWAGYEVIGWLVEVLPVPGGHSAYRYLVPVAAGTLLVRVVLGPREAGAFIPLSAVTAGWIMDSSLGFAAYALVGSLAVASGSLRERPWAGLLSAGVLCGLAQAAMVVALALLGSRLAFAETVLEVGLALSSGLIAALLAMIALPATEVLFGYTTSLRLSELANLNHPLLRELLVQAPGTYHHSILVGALAEAGARAIDADPLLARVGGYYHDVGKIKNPALFAENLRGGQDRAVGMSLEEEAAGLRMHVADGLELGAEHRLGQLLLEIIAQHHGTCTVRQMRETESHDSIAGGPEQERYRQALPFLFRAEPDAGLPRYAGPKPLIREAALILMADTVEAATSKEQDQPGLEAGALRWRVEQTVEEILSEGQLEECGLTLREIRKATDQFVDLLEEMHARRTRPTVSQLPKPAGSDPRVVAPPPVEKDRPN